MTETATSNQPADQESSEQELSTLGLPWRKSWAGLFKALAVSLVVHFFIALVIYFSPSLPGDFELEWEGRMAELSAIGHGDEDFDEDKEMDFDQMAEFEMPARDEAIEEEPGVDEEPEDEPTDEVEPQEAQTEETEPEETEPDEIDPDSETEPASDPESEPDPSPESEPEPAPEPEEPEEDPAEPAVFAGELPGIDRSSPSNLPDMRNYGPGNARVTSLVRTDRIRQTALESHVAALIRAIPDYKIALDGTNLDPVQDLDSFFMASSNPEYLHNTFLAARHSYETDQLQAILDNRYGDPMPWEIDGDRPMRRLIPESANYSDPRRILLAMDGLALIGQPRWFTDLIGPVDADSDLGREIAKSEDGPSVFALLDGLARIEEIAEDENTILLLSAYGVSIKDIPFVDSIPRFRAIRLSITDIESPKLTVDLQMRNEAGARELAEKCPRLRSQIMGLARIFGMHKLLAPLGCRQEGQYVVIEGQYTQAEIIELLNQAPALIEAMQPRSLRGLPSAPEPAPDGEDDL